MIPIFIGYDSKEKIAFHVLMHSLLEQASDTLAVTAIGNTTLPGEIWWRGKGPHDSTEFSNARFMVPYLMGYDGWAIFMDCDMIGLADINDLWNQRQEQYAVMVVKHSHEPKQKTKFLDQEQAQYRRKNWSSLMLFNCRHAYCKELTKERVNTLPGLDLHGFHWCPSDMIGEIVGSWNVLSIPEGTSHPTWNSGDAQAVVPRLLHFTHGGPWHGIHTFGAGLWGAAFRRMLAEKNPKAKVEFTENETRVLFSP